MGTSGIVQRGKSPFVLSGQSLRGISLNLLALQLKLVESRGNY